MRAELKGNAEEARRRLYDVFEGLLEREGVQGAGHNDESPVRAKGVNAFAPFALTDGWKAGDFGDPGTAYGYRQHH